MLQSSLGQPFFWITPSDLWKQHTSLLGPGVTLSASELDVVCYDPQAEMLLHLWQIRNTASIYIHRLRRSKWLPKGLVWAIWVTVENTVCDIIYSEIAIQSSLWSFCLQLHLWVLVLEGLKLGLPPRLLPLIRWIKPPPINFFSPQLFLALITHKTLQVKCSDYWPPTHYYTLIGWRGGETKWLPIRARFRFLKEAFIASVSDFLWNPFLKYLTRWFKNSAAHFFIRQSHLEMSHTDWWASCDWSTSTYLLLTTKTKLPATTQI